MAKPVRFLLAAVTVCLPAAGHAAEDRWTFDFAQGVAEYAVGSFSDGASRLALSCAEAGVRPGSASISLARAGFTPTGPTDATFVTDRGKVTLRLDAKGYADFPVVSAASTFRSLWQQLAKARTLRIAYGPGQPMRLPLTDAASVLGTNVCPKQLAR